MDFKKKTELLVTSLQGNVLFFFNKKTGQSLSTVEFSTYDILKIIRNLDPNKVHGHDMTSIWMWKSCDESICKPLGIIFRSCLQNVVPIFQKKNRKQEVKNYRPISLLPVSSKIFERLLYDRIIMFFTENS